MTRIFRTSAVLLFTLGVWGAPHDAWAGGAPMFDIGALPCMEDADCALSDMGPWCDGDGMCQECVETMHCPEGAMCSATFQCFYPCRSEAECPDELPYCDAPNAECVACIEHGDCDASEYCSFGACFPDFCEADTLFCSGNAVNRCDASGGDFEVEMMCVGDEVCVEQGGKVGCAPPMGGSDSGMGEGGTGGGTTAGGGTTGGVGTMGGSGGTSGAASGDSAGDSAGEAGADGGGGCRVSGPESPWASSMLVLLGLWASSRRRALRTVPSGTRGTRPRWRRSSSEGAYAPACEPLE